MQSVLSGQHQFQYGANAHLNMGWNMGIQRGSSMFLGCPMFGVPMSGMMFGDFSTNMLSRMMNNFMQGGQQAGAQCPCDHNSGLFQPYNDMPYGPRPQRQQQHSHRPQHGTHHNHKSHQQYGSRIRQNIQHLRKPLQQSKPQAKQNPPGVNTVKIGKWGSGKNDSMEAILKGQGFTEKEIYKKDSKGDSLLKKVARANNIKDPNKIKAGGELNVPNSQESLERMEVPDVLEGKTPAQKQGQKNGPPRPSGPKNKPGTPSSVYAKPAEQEVQEQVQRQQTQEVPAEKAKRAPDQTMAQTQTKSQTKKQTQDAEAAKTKTKTYDPGKDAGALYKAMNDGITGLGTDEEAIMKTLKGKSKEEISALKANYKDHYGRELMDDLKGDLNKSELKQATDLMKGNNSKADAEAIKNSFGTFNDDEATVFKTLKGKSAEERKEIQAEYKKLTGKDLDSTLKSRFSKKEYDQASGLLQGNDAKADASKLRDAMSGLTDDEGAVYKTLEGKSAEERAAIQKEYKSLTGKELKDTIGSRFNKQEQTRALSLLDGDNAKADAAKLYDAMKGMGTDEKSINETLKGKSKEERENIAKAFKKEYNIDLDKRMAQDMGGNDLEHSKTLLKDGKISDAKKLKYAMQGIGTDEASIKQVLQGKSKEEIAKLNKAYTAETGRDLQFDVEDELGGRDKFDAGQALKGKAENSAEALERLNERHAFERKGLANKISTSVMDKISSKGELLDKNTARANEANEVYQKALAEGRTGDAKAAKERLDQLTGYGNMDVKTYQEAKDSAADGAGTIAATAASVAVVVATAGTGTPLVAAALAAGGTGAVARTATTAAISGAGYDSQNLGTDAAIGFVDGATTVLGAGAGRAAAAGVKSTKLGGSRVARVAIEGAVDGIVGGAASGGVAEAVKDGTWDNGFKDGLARVGLSTGMGAGMGAVAGGGMGALMTGAPVVIKAGKKAVDGATDLAGRGGKVVGDAARRGGQALDNVVQKGGKAIGDAVDQGGKALGDLADKGGKALGDLTDKGGKALGDLTDRGGKVLDNLADKSGDTGKSAWAKVKDLDAKVREFGDKNTNAVKRAIDNKDASAVTGRAKEVFEQGQQKLKGGVDDLKKAFDGGDAGKLANKADAGTTNFQNHYKKEGWDVKTERTHNDFFPQDMDGKEVAFRIKDAKTGEMVEHRGVLQANSDHRKSAIFELKGQKGEFNNNGISDMAVNKSFDTNFQKKGWKVKSDRTYNDFAPQELNGKEVAFRQPDPKTGEMVDHRGILKSSGDHRKSAIFELQGQKGEFNNNSIREMAVNERGVQGQGLSDLVNKGKQGLNDLADKGKQSLNDLGDKGKKAWGQVKDLDAKVREFGDQNTNAVKRAINNKDASEVTGRAKEVFEQGQQRVKTGVDDVKKAVNSADDSSLTGKAKELWEQGQQKLNNGDRTGGKGILGDLVDRGKQGLNDLGDSGKKAWGQVKDLDAKVREFGDKNTDAVKRAIDNKDASAVTGRAKEVFEQGQAKLKGTADNVKFDPDAPLGDRVMDSSKWTQKTSNNASDMSASKLDGQEVSFMSKDPNTGKMVENRGILRNADPKNDFNSARFKLDGQKGEFNTNGLNDFAVRKFDPDAPLGDRVMDSSKWTQKTSNNASDMSASKLDGQEVSFMSKDPNTGKMVENRGILRNADPKNDFNSARFKLDGQKGEFNTNGLNDFAVRKFDPDAPLGDRVMDSSKWTQKTSNNASDMSASKLDGQEVSFMSKDPNTGKMVENRGILRNADPKNDFNSARFKLDGQKGEFNTNGLNDFAVRKFDPDAPDIKARAPEVKTDNPGVNAKEAEQFNKSYRRDGWDTKEDNLLSMSPERMDGKEVAFLTKDPKTGEMVEREGILRRSTNKDETAMFTLEGQKGEFNNNHIRDMAVNNKSRVATPEVTSKPPELKADSGNVSARTTKSDDGGPAWTEIKQDNGGSIRTRTVKADDGGPAWLETDKGYLTERTRTVAADDGGSAWLEKDIDGIVSRSRTTKAADGGPDWHETVQANSKTTRTRQVPDTDGKGDWYEVSGDEHNFKTRNYKDKDGSWSESIDGGNRWRYRQGGADGLRAEAIRMGEAKVTVAGPKGPIEVNVYGKIDAKQLQMIQDALNDLPPAARQYAGDIYINKNLGEILDPSGKRVGGVGGMGGDGSVIIEAGSTESKGALRNVLYHEMGHNADYGNGTLSSNSKIWGGKSVSDYGSLNACEDFAEVHEAVLSDWKRYSHMKPSSWASESFSAKKLEIVKMYGGYAPSSEEIASASVPAWKRWLGFGGNESSASYDNWAAANKETISRSLGHQPGRVTPETSSKAAQDQLFGMTEV